MLMLRESTLSDQYEWCVLMGVDSMLVGYAVKLAAITGLYVYMYLDNKKRDCEAPVEVYGEDVVKDGIEKGMMVSFLTLVLRYVLTATGSNGTRKQGVQICFIICFLLA